MTSLLAMRSRTFWTMTLGAVFVIALMWSTLRTTTTLAQIAPPPDRAAAPMRPAPRQAAVAAHDDWYVACVDCPKVFSLGNQSLQRDSHNRPHLAYGADHLYYDWHADMQWQYATVDNASGTGRFASLVLDTSDRPHIAYYASLSHDLKYAHWTGSAWQVETVDSTGD